MLQNNNIIFRNNFRFQIPTVKNTFEEELFLLQSIQYFIYSAKNTLYARKYTNCFILTLNGGGFFFFNKMIKSIREFMMAQNK